MVIETGGRWNEEAVEFIRLLALREGSRSAFVHVVADHLGVATPLDQDALHRVLPVVRGFASGTFGQLHHVVLDRW